MNITKRKNKNGEKVYYYFDNGREAGSRRKSGIFTYVKPKSLEERNHNIEAIKLVDIKKAQLIIEQQSIGTDFIPTHKFKLNFFDFYSEYVKKNKRIGNRHLEMSFKHFKEFYKKASISPIDITSNLCLRFRRYLLDNLNGETPANYFARFKLVIEAATEEGYFKINPVSKIFAKRKPSLKLKENLEIEEYIQLLNTPLFNEEIKLAFIFCCYTGLRWCDIKVLKWGDILENVLTTRIIQAKTGKPVILTLHPIALNVLENRKRLLRKCFDAESPVFNLPSANGANKALKVWISSTPINKEITWSCARLSFSILLQDKNVDLATVAYLMGHTTTKQVLNTYRRHRPKDQAAAIANLPSPESAPYFLNFK